MMGSSALPRAITKWAAIFSVAISWGCTSQSFPDSDILYPNAWNTPLPPGVSSDPTTFLNSVSGVPPGDSVHVRTRVGNCAGLCLVQVRIAAMGNTGDIDAKNGPAVGRPVARIENLDPTDTETYFGFRPVTEAEYYFWVDRDPSSGRARLTVIWVPKTGGAVRAGHQRNLKLCHNHAAGYKRVSDVDFFEYKHPVGLPCDAGDVAATAAVNEASLFSARPFVALYAHVKKLINGEMKADGGWIDCNLGCCT
jgi:hypothetical protein